MAAATWPGTLPQDLLLDELELRFPHGSSRSDIDHPLVQQRERFNASVTPLEGTLELTVTQYQTFRTFWQDTLGFGSMPFNWVHPFDGSAVEVRFKPSRPPEISGSSGNKVYVNVSLEILT